MSASVILIVVLVGSLIAVLAWGPRLVAWGSRNEPGEAAKSRRRSS